jgi:D-arabinose 1-dehydrogenase-like Zn-dependent alcohol dehydrogenase
MVEAVSRHQVKPVMDCALPMERAREAFARMEKGDQFGKIVLRIR